MPEPEANYTSYPNLEDIGSLHSGDGTYGNLNDPHAVVFQDFPANGFDHNGALVVHTHMQHAVQGYADPMNLPGGHGGFAMGNLTTLPESVKSEVYTPEVNEDEKDESDPMSPGRSGPIIAKPKRLSTKNQEGQFICTFAACNEIIRTFDRRCEWAKHMDKHERPYVCTIEGCEKLPGFTYSGGLLRHEREVHSKHGGPRKQLNCPHSSCKRHKGKGFSRQENLNEHLRRVHTSIDEGVQPEIAEAEVEESMDDSLNMHRKRPRVEEEEETIDWRSEAQRLSMENNQLRAERAQQQSIIEQMRQDLFNLSANLNAATMNAANHMHMGNSHMEAALEAAGMGVQQRSMIPLTPMNAQ